MKRLFIFFSLVLAASGLFAQVDRSTGLFKALKSNDSLLFNLGFNGCDIKQFENLVSDDFEFYHDKSGITSSKPAFVSSIRDGLCKMAYKPRRELVEGSLEVYPLEKNGVLYGAIQMGKHRFYAIEKDKPEYLTSVAKFTHVWLIENGNWKLSRGLSYDHQEKELKEMSLPEDKDSLIKNTWAKFSRAVLNKDVKTFRAMSVNCLACSWCVTNTPKEDSLIQAYKIRNEKTWSNKLYGELSYIPIEKFISEDYELLFSKETKLRMPDTSKLVFADNNHNSKLYLKSCITGEAKKEELDFREVWLTVIDPSSIYEGAQFAFAFVKIKGHYKFCGFSTVP